MILETISNHSTRCPQMCGLVHFQRMTFTFPQMGQWARLNQGMLRVTTPSWGALVHLLFSLKTLSWQNALTLFQAFPIMRPSSLYSPFLSKKKLHLQSSGSDLFLSLRLSQANHVMHWSIMKAPLCVKLNTMERLEPFLKYEKDFVRFFILVASWSQLQCYVLSIAHPIHCYRSTGWTWNFDLLLY